MLAACLDIICETGWSIDYVRELSVSFVSTLWVRIQHRRIQQMQIMNPMLGLGATSTSQAAGSGTRVTKSYQEQQRAEFWKTRKTAHGNKENLWLNLWDVYDNPSLMPKI